MRPGIHDDRAPDAGGNPRCPFKTTEAVLNAEINELCKTRTGLCHDEFIFKHNPGKSRLKTNHSAANTVIVDYHVAAASDHHVRKVVLLKKTDDGNKISLVFRLKKVVCRSADLHRRVRCQRMIEVDLSLKDIPYVIN